MSPYRDVTAEQRIVDLERQLRERQDTVEALHHENKSLRESNRAEVLEIVLSPGLWGLVTVLTVASIFIWKVAAADGKIDYCYVDTAHQPELRVLFGHRPWRPDAQLRSMPAAEDPAPLFAQAKALDCPIR